MLFFSLLYVVSHSCAILLLFLFVLVSKYCLVYIKFIDNFEQCVKAETKQTKQDKKKKPTTTTATASQNKNKRKRGNCLSKTKHCITIN